MPTLSRRIYVQQVLNLYRRVPGTSGHLRLSDRRFAGKLHDRGVSLEMVHAALLLAVTRRTFRSPTAPPLAPIATLHYIQPLIDELIAEPPEPGYLAYIQNKLATVAPHFVAAVGHHLP